jgi:hypothetical protein
VWLFPAGYCCPGVAWLRRLGSIRHPGGYDRNRRGLPNLWVRVIPDEPNVFFISGLPQGWTTPCGRLGTDIDVFVIGHVFCWYRTTCVGHQSWRTYAKSSTLTSAIFVNLSVTFIGRHSPDDGLFCLQRSSFTSLIPFKSLRVQT